ncbi:5-(carboxyamino)imidazole ribonucleotide synthase [Psychrosphaera haliotis]|uniref:5-(carboxyamino)imidazole ribonucleotide synthase n=1 Tax=Psychrosphaera haliotis TaxID=555083 RepID=UPI0031E069EB
MAPPYFSNSSLNDDNNLVVILGHGQLARMMYLESTQLGLNIIAVNANTRECVNPVDKTVLNITLDEAFDDAAVITSEFEHLPLDLLAKAELSGKFLPNAKAIHAGADRIVEKKLLDSVNVRHCQNVIVNGLSDLDKASETLGERIILKTSRDGYDGYGQWRIFSPQDLVGVKSQLNEHNFEKMPLVAERCINFERELSLVGVTDKNGNHKFYPLTENHHADGQLVLSLAPAPRVTLELEQQAQDIYKKISEQLDYCGVLAIEFFQLKDQLIVNEIAPRVHNSGHWTQQGSVTSQFENHIRAVAGYPLGETRATSCVAMINYVGQSKPKADLFTVPNVHLHWYDKQVRPKRKMGHINVTGSTPAQLLETVKTVKNFLPDALATNLAPLINN